MFGAIQALPLVCLAFQCDPSSYWRESNASVAEAFGPVVAPSNARSDAFCPWGTNLFSTSTQLFASEVDEIGGSRSPRSPSIAVEQPRRLLTPDEELTLLQRTSDYRAIRTAKDDLETRLSRRVNASELAGELSPSISTSELTQRLERGQAAREELISRNMGLVHHVASKYVSGGGGASTSSKSPSRLQSLSYDDLVQEGVIGLTRAVDRYDLRRAKDNRFSTYAVYWIRAAVLRAISSQDELIRIPEHVTASIRKVQGAARRLGLDMDVYADGVGADWRTDAAEGALAVEAGLTRSQLREALAVASRRGAARRSGVVELQPWMQDASTPPNEASATANGQQPGGSESNVKEVLARFLRPKEVQAITLRYGLSPESDDTTFISPAPGAATRRPFRDYEAEAESDLFPSMGSSSSAATAEQFQRPLAASNEEPPEVPKRGRWGEAMTFKEVGKRMAISAEYGRRLCSAALEKLRAAARDGHLEPEFLMP